MQVVTNCMCCVVCSWGTLDYLPTPPVGSFKALTAGVTRQSLLHCSWSSMCTEVCGLTMTSQMICDGLYVLSGAVKVPSKLTVKRVASGPFHVCWQLLNDTVTCSVCSITRPITSCAEQGQNVDSSLKLIKQFRASLAELAPVKSYRIGAKAPVACPAGALSLRALYVVNVVQCRHSFNLCWRVDFAL